MRKAIFLSVMIAVFPVIGSARPATNNTAVNSFVPAGYTKLTHDKSGYRSLFNAAGKAAHEKRYGYAVLLWERALLVYDGDSVCRENISTVKALTGADRFEVGIPVLVRIFLFFYFSFSRTVLFIIIVSGIIVFFVFINTGILLRRSGDFRFRIIAAVLLGIVIISAVSLSLRNSRAADSSRAVVVRKDTPFRQHRSGDSSILLKLPEGLEVSIASAEDDSLRISLPGGGQGWIPSAAAVRINPRR